MSLLRHEADDYEREGANDKFAEATSKILEIWNSDDAEREVGFLNFLTETINAIERTGAEIAPEVIAESDPDDEDGEISFWYSTGCVRANTRIFEVLNAFVLLMVI